MKTIVYVGCALTHASNQFKKDVADVKEILRQDADIEILEFVGLTGGTNESVYHHDIHECVAKCDIFVAIVDHPSLGLGYEAGTAVEKHGKPTLAVAHKDALVTRLILGVQHENYSFARYSSMVEEVPELVQKFIAAKTKKPAEVT